MPPKWLDELTRQRYTVFPKWGLTDADAYEVLKLFSEFFNYHDRKYLKALSPKGRTPFYPIESLITATVCYYLEQKKGFYSYEANKDEWAQSKNYRKRVKFWLHKLYDFYGTKPHIGANKIIEANLPELEEHEKTFLLAQYNHYPSVFTPRKKVAALVKMYYPEKYRTKEIFAKFHFNKNNSSKLYIAIKRLKAYDEKHST